jgi:hypothetical protein
MGLMMGRNGSNSRQTPPSLEDHDATYMPPLPPTRHTVDCHDCVPECGPICPRRNSDK